MKTQQTKQQFVLLKSQGLSLRKISEELNVSLTILVEWNKQLKSEIYELENEQANEILHKYKLSKLERVEFISSELKNTFERYKHEKFLLMNKSQILKIIVTLQKMLINETKPILNQNVSKKSVLKKQQLKPKSETKWNKSETKTQKT